MPVSTADAYRQLFDLMRGWRGLYVGAMLLMGLAVAIDYLIPVVLAGSVDLVLGSTAGSGNEATVGILRSFGVRPGEPGTLWIPAVLIVLIAVVSGGLIFLKGRWVGIACEGVIRSLRDRLYDHLQRAPLAFHDKLQSGDVVQRCTSDVETLRNFYTNQIVEIARSALLLLAGVPLLFYLDWRMAIAAVSVLPLIIGFSIIFFTKVKHRFKAADDAEGLMSAVLQENLTGIRVVRAFNRQDFEIARFDEKNRTHRDLDWKMYKLMSLFWSASDAMCFAQILIVLGYGCHSVSHGRITVGELLFFLTAVWRFLWPVREMGRTLTELGKAVVSVGRVHEIASQPGEESAKLETRNPKQIRTIEPGNDRNNHLSPPPPSSLRGSVALSLQTSAPPIEIRNLSFAHGEKQILSDITLSIPPGQTLGIIGPSGAGKTSLIALLLRFYDYSIGSVTIGGIELRDIPRDQVRALFGVVMQEPFLFSKTLRENIRLGRADIHQPAEEEIIQAAKQAVVHESIEGFDKKYDTLIGERGVTLSGGQRQRVAIARALLRNSPILVLDDALSAVDTHTESQILNALASRKSLTQGRRDGDGATEGRRGEAVGGESVGGESVGGESGGGEAGSDEGGGKAVGGQTTIIIAHRLSTLMHADQIAVLEHGRLTQLGTHAQLVAQAGLYQRLWHIQTELEEDLQSELGSPPTNHPPSHEPQLAT